MTKVKIARNDNSYLDSAKSQILQKNPLDSAKHLNIYANLQKNFYLLQFANSRAKNSSDFCRI